MKPLYLLTLPLLVSHSVLAQETSPPVANVGTPVLVKATISADQPLLDKTVLATKALEELSRAQGTNEGTLQALSQEKTHLDKAASLLNAPTTFSLGQGPRQARLILDSVVAARAWVETARKEAPTASATRFEETLKALVHAEQEAATRVELQDKPSAKTTEQLLEEGDRIRAKSARELPEVEKEAIASRKRNEELTLKMQRLIDADKEEEKRNPLPKDDPEKRRKEDAAFEADGVRLRKRMAQAKVDEEHDKLLSAYIEKINSGLSIRDRIAKETDPKVRKDLLEKLAMNKMEVKQSRQTYDDAIKKDSKAVDDPDQLRPTFFY